MIYNGYGSAYPDILTALDSVRRCDARYENDVLAVMDLARLRKHLDAIIASAKATRDERKQITIRIDVPGDGLPTSEVRELAQAMINAAEDAERAEDAAIERAYRPPALALVAGDAT